jgi:hypothetical protein
MVHGSDGYEAANLWHPLYAKSHNGGNSVLQTRNILCELNHKTHFGNSEIVFMNIQEHT